MAAVAEVGSRLAGRVGSHSFDNNDIINNSPSGERRPGLVVTTATFGSVQHHEFPQRAGEPADSESASRFDEDRDRRRKC